MFCLLLCLAASAEHTRRWRQSSYDEFVKGTAHGVAVRSDGRLELAPKFTCWQMRTLRICGLCAWRRTAACMLRAVRRLAFFVLMARENRRWYLSPRISRRKPSRSTPRAFCIVGTSPDGKVYKVSTSGEKSIFFDPKCKYIWDLPLEPMERLYVATGDKGQIFAVAPDGKSSVFYASDEAHIRVLAFDAKGRLLAGTEPSGRVLRSHPARRQIERKQFRQERYGRQQGAAPKVMCYMKALNAK